jgi:Cys-tRNA(Pro)/Cys-tRNA(Cys) deacylase
MPGVNNVTRFLDSHQVAYTAFELPAEKLSAVEAAHFLNVPEDVVFKTIVILREVKGKTILALVPGAREVDMKSLAKVVGEKKLQPATQREAEKLTGLLTGGISPLALINRGFQVVVDQTALDCEAIYISGGQRGLNIRLSPQDLIDLTHAQTADISR